MSENFANDAAIGSATFDATGSLGTAANALVTVQYNAANQSYSLSSASGAITFTPADIDASRSNAGAIVYVKSNGATADTLTLTRPGTSGPVTYTYVGSIFWQHTRIGTSDGSGFIDAAAYGVKTPDAVLPRTGSANYAVDLLGAETVGDNIVGLSGQGIASVDFAAGAIVTIGRMTRAIGGGDTTFASVAHIGASANQFDGDFRFEDFGTLKGTLSGRFYGPAAQEIGAAFAATQADGRVAVGTIMGRQGPADLRNESFNAGSAPKPLTNSQMFVAIGARDNYVITGASGSNSSAGTFSNASTRLETTLVRYDATTNSYTLVGPDANSTFVQGDIFDPELRGTKTFTMPSQFSVVPTSYVRIGSWLSSAGAGSNTSYRDAYFAFGMPTAASDIVRSGTAGFKVSVLGRAADNDYPNVTTFSGKGDLFVDFAGGTLNALIPLDFVEDYFISGRPTGRTRGDLRLAATLGAANGFSGAATMNGIGAYNGTSQGQFFGPGSAEVGGAFSLTDGAGGVAAGAFAGMRDATVTDPTAPVPRLADLTSATNLGFVVTTTSSAVGDVVGITYDPATQGYRVSFQDTHLSGAPVRTVTLDATSQNSATSDASYRRYNTVIDVTKPVTAALLRTDNPQVTLSYASLGEFVIQRGSGPFDWARFYAVSGIATTRMPSTGTASYSGIAHGVASVATVSAPGQSASTLYDLNGTSGMSVNFADQSFTATLGNLVGTPAFNGDGTSVTGMANRSFDPLNFSGSLTGATFSAGVNGHSFSGRFFGPGAAEFGAIFHHADGTPYASPVAIQLWGAAVGKRQ